MPLRIQPVESYQHSLSPSRRPGLSAVEMKIIDTVTRRGTTKNHHPCPKVAGEKAHMAQHKVLGWHPPAAALPQPHHASCRIIGSPSRDICLPQTQDAARLTATLPWPPAALMRRAQPLLRVTATSTSAAPSVTLRPLHIRDCAFVRRFPVGRKRGVHSCSVLPRPLPKHQASRAAKDDTHPEQRTLKRGLQGP